MGATSAIDPHVKKEDIQTDVFFLVREAGLEPACPE